MHHHLLPPTAPPARRGARFNRVGAAATAALLLACGACHHSLPSTIYVPLNYADTHDRGDMAFTVPQGAPRVFVAPVTDNRPITGDGIGENRQEEHHIPVMATGRSPADFVHQVIEQELRSDGVMIVSTPDMADRILTVGLTNFEADESPNYHANVSFNVSVTDKGGASLANGVLANGEAGTYGSSGNPNDYQKVLSNASARATDSLLHVEEFQHALSKAAMPVQAPAAMKPADQYVPIQSSGPSGPMEPGFTVGPTQAPPDAGGGGGAAPNPLGGGDQGGMEQVAPQQ